MSGVNTELEKESLRLNTIQPALGSKIVGRRVGRGIGSGLGKTCGKGHKGQKSRSGGYHKVGFEGGQMPIQRRLPKFGFTSRKSLTRKEVNLYELNRVEGDVVDLDALKKADLVRNTTTSVKVVASGEIKKVLTLKGIAVTKGARKAIEAAGGKVEE